MPPLLGHLNMSFGVQRPCSRGSVSPQVFDMPRAISSNPPESLQGRGAEPSVGVYERVGGSITKPSVGVGGVLSSPGLVWGGLLSPGLVWGVVLSLALTGGSFLH